MRNMIVATAVAAACFTSVNSYAADETTKISGIGFIDLSNIDKTTTTKASGLEVKDVGNGIGLDVKRFYVGVDHVFDDIWSANVTTDFQYSSGISATEVFIKKAYLQAKVNDAFIIRAGSASMPWIDGTESLYGYRYVEKTVTDLEGVVNTADWGVHVLGKSGNGMFSYGVSAVNGGGFKNPTRSKSVDLEGRLSFVPVKGLNFALGAYSGKRGKETDLNPAENTFTRYDVLVAYVVDKFRVGVEYYSANNPNTVQQDGTPAAPNGVIPSAATIDTDKTHAYSGWAAFNFLPNASVFARYDDQKVNPNDTTNSVRETTNKYLHLGVSYQPRKNIDLAFVYKNTKTDTNDTSAAAKSSKTDEIGVFSQVKF
jgi:hypothetical protein